MISKIISFLLGINICAISIMYDLIYLNLLKMGFSILDYLKYIFTRLECLIIFLGIGLIIYSLRKNKYNSNIIVKNTIRRIK